MLWQKYNINWNNFPTHQKRGTCVVKNEVLLEYLGDGKVNAYLRDPSRPAGEWIIDKEIPIFKGEDRDYIEVLVNYVEDK